MRCRICLRQNFTLFYYQPMLSGLYSTIWCRSVAFNSITRIDEMAFENLPSLSYVYDGSRVSGSGKSQIYRFIYGNPPMNISYDSVLSVNTNAKMYARCVFFFFLMCFVFICNHFLDCLTRWFNLFSDCKRFWWNNNKRHSFLCYIRCGPTLDNSSICSGKFIIII